MPLRTAIVAASLVESNELLPGMFEPVHEHLAQTLKG
jgi:hypothetical protein